MNRKFALDTFIFITLMLLALLFRVGVACAFPNLLWPDEVFQTLEQAHRLAFNNGIVPWEFRDGTRSWIFPGILAGVMGITAWMGEGSSGYLTGVTIFLCLLSLIPIWVAFSIGDRTGGLAGAVLSAGVCLVWFELVYFAPKALNEVVAAHLLLLGVYLGIYSKYFQLRTRLFLAGCLCGLTIALRIHLVPAVAFAVVYICRKDWREKWLPMVAGILGPLLAAGALDAFTWSYPFQSFWQNVWVNVVEGKSRYWGVSPWYEYLILPLKTWSLALMPIAFLCIFGARRSPILAWLAIIIVLSHSVIAHKEYRFIYPALLMAIILAGLGTAELVEGWRSRSSLTYRGVIAVLVCLILWTSISAVLASRFYTDRKATLSMLWDIPEITHWTLHSGNLKAFQKLSTEEMLCGVGLQDVPWWESGGYTYLHRDVPIFLLEDNIDFERLAPSFNYLVSKLTVPPQHQIYRLQKCWGATCLYKRPGSCVEIEGYHINQILEQTGQ